MLPLPIRNLNTYGQFGCPRSGSTLSKPFTPFLGLAVNSWKQHHYLKHCETKHIASTNIYVDWSQHCPNLWHLVTFPFWKLALRTALIFLFPKALFLKANSSHQLWHSQAQNKALCETPTTAPLHAKQGCSKMPAQKLVSQWDVQPKHSPTKLQVQAPTWTKEAINFNLGQNCLQVPFFADFELQNCQRPRSKHIFFGGYSNLFPNPEDTNLKFLKEPVQRGDLLTCVFHKAPGARCWQRKTSASANVLDWVWENSYNFPTISRYILWSWWELLHKSAMLWTCIANLNQAMN